MRSLAVAGFGLVATMQAIFFLFGFERGPAYEALQVLGFVGAAAAAYGLHGGGRLGVAMVAGGMWVGTLVRVLFSVLGLTRLPAALNVALMIGYGAVALFATLWAAAPSKAAAHAAGARAAAFLLAIAVFLAAYRALSAGALSSAVALLLGCVGFFLVAPNLAPSQSGSEAA